METGERERTESYVSFVSLWYQDYVSFFPQTCEHLKCGNPACLVTDESSVSEGREKIVYTNTLTVTVFR